MLACQKAPASDRRGTRLEPQHVGSNLKIDRERGLLRTRKSSLFTLRVPVWCHTVWVWDLVTP